MIITSLEVFPVQLPFSHSVADSWGEYRSSKHGIVIVHTESGHYGAGEVALAWFGGAHSLAKEMEELWRPAIVGEDCRNVSHIMKKLDRFLHFSKRHLLAKAGVEMALFDLLGKTLNVPVYQLLGGKMRDFIPLTGGINIDQVDRMVEAARQKEKEGYTELKIKVGLDSDKDLLAIRQIRNAVPDRILLRADANMAWKNAKEAKALIDEMYEFGVHIVEQPLPDNRLEDLAWLRKQVKAKILLDESVWDANDAKRCLEAGAADMLHVYTNEAGGLAESRKIFELASLYQIPCTIGSMPEARIGAAASLHLGIAMENLSDYASDIRGFTAYKEDVVHEELRIVNGRLYPGDLPGLGVTVDFEKLRHLTAHE